MTCPSYGTNEYSYGTARTVSWNLAQMALRAGHSVLAFESFCFRYHIGMEGMRIHDTLACVGFVAGSS